MDRKFHRSARLRSASFNADDNTIEVIWTTGAAVERWDPWSGDEFVEVLSLEPGAVRLERLNAGAPFLDTHDSTDLSKVVGSVMRGSASIDGGKGIATVRLSRAAADRDTVSKIADGIICNISVGYIIHAVTKAEVDGRTVHTVTDWEPLELSAVPIPADPGAQIRSASGRFTRSAGAGERAAEIRRYARTAGMTALGEEHIRRGTSADAFFNLVAERLAGRPAPLGQNMTNDQADLAVGKREWAKVAALRGPANSGPSKPLGRDDGLTPEQRRFKAEHEEGAATFRKLLGKR